MVTKLGHTNDDNTDFTLIQLKSGSSLKDENDYRAEPTTHMATSKRNYIGFPSWVKSADENK